MGLGSASSRCRVGFLKLGSEEAVLLVLVLVLDWGGLVWGPQVLLPGRGMGMS